LVGVLLVGSVALAQQGLIVEPWRKAPTPANAPVPPLRAMPASGLVPFRGATVVAMPAAQPQPATVPGVPALSRWSPPVVELLVDPWARGQVAAPVVRPRWVPSNVDIVDPWARSAQASTEPPRVARAATAGPSRPAGAPHSTIF
jgi:hypothetical protein